jgi:lipopolysaccharide export system protein LptA
MKFNRFFTPIFSAIVLTFSGMAHCLPSDKDAPVNIEADSGEIDQATGTTIYQGAVIITQGSMKLEANKVTIQYKNKKPYQFIATGTPARFKQKPEESKPWVRGQGNKIVYLINSEELVLTDNAELQQGGDSFSSDRIVYDRVKAKLRAGAAAKGKQRVKVTIQPKNLR